MENTENGCRFFSYRISFVIFAFFLLSGFVIGAALFKTGFNFNGSTLLISGAADIGNTADTGSAADKGSAADEVNVADIGSTAGEGNAADAEHLPKAEEASGKTETNIPAFKTVMRAFFLSFRYLLIIFLCGFTAFSPLFSVFCVTYRGVVFGFSASLLYSMIQSGASISSTVFSAFPRLAFIICFIAGAVNTVLCINLCCVSGEFSYLIRRENAGFSEIMTYERAGKYAVCLLFAAFVQLCVSLFCCLFSGIVI